MDRTSGERNQGGTAAILARAAGRTQGPQFDGTAAQRAVSEGRAPSVSAYISRALDEHDGAGSLSELVALLRAEDGPPSAADYAWADSVLAVTRPPRRRARDDGR